MLVKFKVSAEVYLVFFYEKIQSVNALYYSNRQLNIFIDLYLIIVDVYLLHAIIVSFSFGLINEGIQYLVRFTINVLAEVC